MDDGAIMRTYGNTDLPGGTEDRPLVTFALFAYNQEKYIREAVEGAFSQSYSPLEIILSDDCSSDRTFEIMEEMAREYRGPHAVKLRQSVQNRGVIEHINEVAEKASGAVLVLAAGDDVSFPERTEQLLGVFFIDPEIYAVFSDFNTVNTSVTIPKKNSTVNSVSLREISFNGGGVGAGATYAYRKQCFSWPAKLPSSLVSEDKILPLRAAMLGKVAHLDQGLIFYRPNLESLSLLLEATGRFALQRKDHVHRLIAEIHFAKETGNIGFVDSLACKGGLLVAHYLAGKSSKEPSRHNLPRAALMRAISRIIRLSIPKRKLLAKT